MFRGMYVLYVAYMFRHQLSHRHSGEDTLVLAIQSPNKDKTGSYKENKSNATMHYKISP